MNAADFVIASFDGENTQSEQFLSLMNYGCSNFILFAKNQNYKNPEQLIQLTEEIQKNCANNSLPALISVDQEGGKVQRFRNGFTLLPEAIKVGKLSATDQYKLGCIQASELYHAGINLNFAPVADIHTNENNPVIGTRAYGTTAQSVSNSVTQLIKAHLDESVLPCIKHFPGHGDTFQDSHLELPIIKSDLNQIKKNEWLPFQTGIEKSCPAVMTSHILFENIDAQYPATMSKKILSTLTQELHFSGVIISDDFQMGAIAHNYELKDSIKTALLAGCDLICTNTYLGCVEIIDCIQQLIDNNELPIELLNKKLDRIQALKRKIKPNTSSIIDRLNKIGIKENQDWVNQIVS